MSDLKSTERFSDRVENYVKYRPGYPEAVFSFLKTKFGVGPTSTLADIGSGTGISTEPLLNLGATVYAVEPNQAMRRAAEHSLSRFPNFRTIEGTAESTALPDGFVDLVFAAQAFHWFDPKKTRIEFSRILKPKGLVFLLWNERLESGTPFLEAYEDLLLKFGTDYEKVRRRNTKETGALDTLFGPTGYKTETFPNSQSFDFEGLKGRLLSSSYAPNEDHPNHSPMLIDLKKIFTRHSRNGTVEMVYETRAYYGPIL